MKKSFMFKAVIEYIKTKGFIQFKEKIKFK